jgi:hypothetical protein
MNFLVCDETTRAFSLPLTALSHRLLPLNIFVPSLLRSDVARHLSGSFSRQSHGRGNKKLHAALACLPRLRELNTDQASHKAQ